ncbi:MAG: DUF4426 domain-containing protein [Woeseiaceae bacterium]|nr:DUF4426 domain-containing protein [Woeseiaceae bacterium]
MKISNTLVAGCLAFLLAACGGPGGNAEVPQAQPADATFAEIGDWVVHFNAQTTDQLSPEIASAYGITRSQNRPMMTLSVLRKADNTPVSAEVSMRAVNLTGQLKNFTIQEITDQGAIYYLGFSSSTVAHLERLRFEISVTPEGATESSDVVFSRQFYID